jgi:hypothetical protein
MGRSAWYDTRLGLWSFWWAVGLTVLVVGVSTTLDTLDIPPYVYVFGFLGAMVYVFTSFAKRFAQDDRYVMKILSRTVAVLPLAAGVFMLSGSFLDVGDSAFEVDAGTRLLGGLVFLAGIYVSITLQALGNLAERLLGFATGEGTTREGDAVDVDGGSSTRGDVDGGDASAQ